MRIVAVATAVAVLVACVPSGQFDRRFARTACEANNACLVAAGLGGTACDDFEPEASSTVECDYDGAAARSCLHDLHHAECQGPIIRIPDSCTEVYTSCSSF